MAEATAGRNRTGVRRSARGGTDGAHDVGLAAAYAARDGKHDQTVIRRQASHHVARLFEADADLERKTRRAESPLVARENPAKATGDRVRTVGGTQTSGAETIQAALVQSLIGEAPRDRLAGAQLLAAYGTQLTTNSGLDVGERGGSAARRSHGGTSSNPGAIGSRKRDA